MKRSSSSRSSIEISSLISSMAQLQQKLSEVCGRIRTKIGAMCTLGNRQPGAPGKLSASNL
jgi:hypothetical protein